MEVQKNKTVQITASRFVRLPALLVASLALGACQTKPTVVRETVSRSFGGSQALLGPIELSEDVVIADARPPFDFSMARVPRSVAINWADYSEAEGSKRGWPQKDLFAAARRLARLGIAPGSKVVVLGNGKEGQGEEGRVAWLLAYLGIENVRFGRFGSVKSRITTEALPEDTKSEFSERASSDPRSPQPAEVPATAKSIWKPQVVNSLIATREEVLGAIENNAMEKPWSFNGAKAKLYRFIDARPEAEYLGKTGGFRARLIPNLNALNVPWKEFFDADFRPLAETAQRLVSIGVLARYRIIVLDNDGVASGAVTMALRAYGYSDAANYAGGFNDLMAK
jgi:thiosulfate/3-mercaptopyruvate sulfurtransferase